ncbi:phosphoadenosine phosphosulfate reductase family protein [uncultured Sphingorhabdus sp.]|uniref:phosphoadenosine phosphosulfate reductase domain-containing protein n=1 Tax=uncultured Sphingorhabdus sp. TaxID=1686106 RepID=UPI00263107F1|nr:phosphoadenosine phosphosulfate reductase family protein [uncultured Sphingorhabdus sp.]HMS21760.1 phosphoadenosine phosphosulfate reductase family protein [Sphingorhabdus sp.]
MTSTSIDTLIQRGALFVVNHSGGKDSQAMFAKISKLVPAHQTIIIHAILPEVEWDGVIEHIKRTTGNVPLLFAKAKKTFFEMVEHRSMFPSPSYRQCTSDLKRNPIEREIRRFLKDNPSFGGLVVNCMGMRAQESTGRANLEPLQLNQKNSKAGREWYDWLPIHDWLIDEVFSAISDAGQEPHWAYAAGMSRLSCCFCIMANQSDLTTAARLAPALYQRYVDTERRLNYTLSPSRKSLPDLTGIPG